jgi:hypothetical protein
MSMVRERTKENNPIHNSFKKYLGIDLCKEVKDFYNETVKH